LVFFFFLFFFFFFFSRDKLASHWSRRMSEGSSEKKLHSAADDGILDEVKEILRSNFTLDVNWEDSRGCTAFHRACRKGHDDIVSILLAHPNIDVNPKNDWKETPFMLACSDGKTSYVCLLKDSRVNIDEPDGDGHTPLWRAASHGHLALIKWWIVSGREMDLGQPGNENTDAIRIARNPGEDRHEVQTDFETRKHRCAEVVTLLERFKKNPEDTRSDVRKELGIKGG